MNMYTPQFYTTNSIIFRKVNLISSRNDFNEADYFLFYQLMRNTCVDYHMHIKTSSEDQFIRVIFIFDRS